MFHTADGYVVRTTWSNRQVVIPWRGFRCFTHKDIIRPIDYNVFEVVIPWRGFRCFTLRTDRRRRAGISTNVVIPWRGFRCFTLGP